MVIAQLQELGYLPPSFRHLPRIRHQHGIKIPGFQGVVMACLLRLRHKNHQSGKQKTHNP